MTPWVFCVFVSICAWISFTYIHKSTAESRHLDITGLWTGLSWSAFNWTLVTCLHFLKRALRLCLLWNETVYKTPELSGILHLVTLMPNHAKSYTLITTIRLGILSFLYNVRMYLKSIITSTGELYLTFCQLLNAHILIAQHAILQLKYEFMTKWLINSLFCNSPLHDTVHTLTS